MDGIDAVLASSTGNKMELIASHTQAYPDELKNQLEKIIKDPNIHLDELGQLDVRIAKEFAYAVNKLLSDNDLNASDVTAIGSHGQTIRHRIQGAYPFSMQIGNANVIAVETGITTIADFRSKDIALGGQGAPLVPTFHKAMFATETSDRIVVNIGGISNLSLLKKKGRDDNNVRGHDCGPGNTLIDQWAQKHIQMPYDHSGAWASMGQVEHTLLLQLMTDDYFKQAPPKSTGREYFNLLWLENSLSNFPELDPVDTQATLCELSAQCIARDINALIQSDELDLDKVYVCGGGVHNKFLMQRLSSLIPCDLSSTDTLGIAADWVEALAFAWLAKQTYQQQPGNSPTVTGAERETILGGLFYP